MPKKILINVKYGGFCAAGPLEEYAKKNNIDFRLGENNRDDPEAIKIVEECGCDVCCNRTYSKLKIVEIPDEATDWEIDSYDGYEEVIYVLDGKIKRIIISPYED